MTLAATGPGAAVIIAMDRAVLQFLRLGFTHIDNLYVELQVDACEGMIGVDADLVPDNGNDGGDPVALGRLGLESHAGNQVDPVWELAAVGICYQSGIMFTIGLSCGDDGGHLVTGRLPFEFLL